MNPTEGEAAGPPGSDAARKHSLGAGSNETASAPTQELEPGQLLQVASREQLRHPASTSGAQTDDEMEYR